MTSETSTLRVRYRGGNGIGHAVDLLREGHRVARRGWNGKGMWLELQRPNSLSRMTEPYVFMCTAQKGLIPWLASQADLLAEDWEVVSYRPAMGRQR